MIHSLTIDKWCSDPLNALASSWFGERLFMGLCEEDCQPTCIKLPAFHLTLLWYPRDLALSKHTQHIWSLDDFCKLREKANAASQHTETQAFLFRTMQNTCTGIIRNFYGHLKHELMRLCATSHFCLLLRQSFIKNSGTKHRQADVHCLCCLCNCWVYIWAWLAVGHSCRFSANVELSRNGQNTGSTIELDACYKISRNSTLLRNFRLHWL